MGQVLHILTEDAAGHHAEAEAAFQALQEAKANHPRLRDAAIRRELVRSCERMNRDEVAEMLEQITEAKAALEMAENALFGLGSSIDTLAARSLMNEAIGYLSDAE